MKKSAKNGKLREAKPNKIKYLWYSESLGVRVVAGSNPVAPTK
jgi:hypothetical protein